jgi:uncharacterized protein YjaZ
MLYGTLAFQSPLGLSNRDGNILGYHIVDQFQPDDVVVSNYS